MTGAPPPFIVRDLRSGAPWTGPRDADLDGVVEVRTDWARAPLSQILTEAPALPLTAEVRRDLVPLVEAARARRPGSLRRLRAFLRLEVP